jgi:hypothetical protein
VRLAWNLDPFSSFSPGRWGNLWCGGQWHYRGIDSTEVRLRMGLDRDHGPDPLIRPFGYID